jgi:hypothetical protein
MVHERNTYQVLIEMIVVAVRFVSSESPRWTDCAVLMSLTRPGDWNETSKTIRMAMTSSAVTVI